MNVDRAKLFLKQDALNELLRTHFSVYVHCDTRTPGVILPKQLLGRPQVCLELGLNMPTPIREFAMNDNGWTAVMSFGSTAFRCFLPWKAVFFIVGDSGFGAQWPVDVPVEAVVQPAADAAASGTLSHGAVPEPLTAPKRELPKGWRVIEGGGKGKPPAPLLKPPPTPKRGYRRPGPFIPPAS